MTGNSVTQTIQTRKSVRVFKQQSVDKALLTEILLLAGQSPSGGNVQPWKVYALTGEAKDKLTQAIVKKIRTNTPAEQSDLPIYPSRMIDPWNQRRKDCGELMFQALEISKDNKPARMVQFVKNFTFFDAPVGLIITVDRTMSNSQLMDTGIFLQSLMLLAKERGLDTCPQACWTTWPDTIREVLDIDETIVAGMALGYAENNAPVNIARQPRMVIDNFVSFRGF